MFVGRDYMFGVASYAHKGKYPSKYPITSLKEPNEEEKNVNDRAGAQPVTKSSF